MLATASFARVIDISTLILLVVCVPGVSGLAANYIFISADGWCTRRTMLRSIISNIMIWLSMTDRPRSLHSHDSNENVNDSEIETHTAHQCVFADHGPDVISCTWILKLKFNHFQGEKQQWTIQFILNRVFDFNESGIISVIYNNIDLWAYFPVKWLLNFKWTRR